MCEKDLKGDKYIERYPNLMNSKKDSVAKTYDSPLANLVWIQMSHARVNRMCGGTRIWTRSPHNHYVIPRETGASQIIPKFPFILDVRIFSKQSSSLLYKARQGFVCAAPPIGFFFRSTMAYETDESGRFRNVSSRLLWWNDIIAL